MFFRLYTHPFNIFYTSKLKHYLSFIYAYCPKPICRPTCLVCLFKSLPDDEIRCLGVFITRSRKFKCSIDNAKRSFHRAVNGIFGKVGRLASEEVVVQLLLHKCMPILLYALEVCALDKRSVQSLDFTINRFFMK